MEQKKHLKISLKLAVVVAIIMMLLICIIGAAIYMKVIKDNTDVKATDTPKFVGENNEIEDDIPNETSKLCKIKGKDSNLLYKNEYESDTSYLEKVIYLDEEAKNKALSAIDVLDVNEVLKLGKFEEEFIRVKYSSDLDDYEMSLAYIQDESFFNCKTNKIIKKVFDKNGNEIDMPEIDFNEFDIDIPSNISNVYALFDITNKNGEEYIIGMYDKVFPENNPNALVITVVLRKQNANIDIEDEGQVKKFWGKYANYEIEEVTESTQKDYEEVNINGKVYYHKLTENTWKGEYHQDKYYTSNSNNKKEVVSYDDYINYIKEISSNAEKEIKNYYTDKKSNYIILSYASGMGWCDMQLIDCVEKNNQIVIYGDENDRGVMSSGSGYLIAIPTNMPVGTNIQYRECYSTSEISNLKNYGTSQTETTIDKPIIYLYPTEEKKVTVKLLKDKNLTTSYPKYKSEWKVLAKPNGDLRDLTTNRQLYSLYYESNNSLDFKVNNDGFVVKGEETIKFLEEKLAILGLTEREAEEFIVYWLPKLEANKYNYIRFATMEEINENMPLEIDPNPDTIIRVIMTFKGLDEPIDVEEQKLTTPDRKGFVAVEWGGTEIK